MFLFLPLFLVDLISCQTFAIPSIPLRTLDQET